MNFVDSDSFVKKFIPWSCRLLFMMPHSNVLSLILALIQHSTDEWEQATTSIILKEIDLIEFFYYLYFFLS